MVEAGLHRPDLSQWLPEYDLVPWPKGQSSSHDHTTGPDVFSHLLPIVDSTLGRGGRLDNDQQVTPALFLESMHYLSPSVKRGAVAYALWMAKLGSDYSPTNYKGADISKSMIELGDWLGLPQETIQYIKTSLEGRPEDQYPPMAGGLLREWLGVTQGKQPLMDWLGEEVRKAEEANPL